MVNGDLEDEMQQIETKIKLQKHLLSGDNKFAMPPGAKPLRVIIETTVYGIPDISELNFEFTVAFFFRLQWLDPRLKFNPVEYRNLSHIMIHPGEIEKLWIPEIYFKNEKTKALFQPLSSSNSVFIVYHDGWIFFSRNLEITIRCQMNFRSFPFDEQTCPVEMSTYGYNTDEVETHVKKGPVFVHSGVLIPAGFSLVSIQTKQDNITMDKGTFPLAELKFVLSRSSGFYILQVSSSIVNLFHL